jgi:5-methyltetrahydropteroyltriglutamate--homocysteine methyltransferase
MKGSHSRILTTHVGSLPRPDALLELNRRRIEGEVDEDEFQAGLTSAVADVVAMQAKCGVDIVNDGEFGKAMSVSSDYGAWLSYAYERLGGWEMTRPGDGGSLQMRDADEFPDLYPKMWEEIGGGEHGGALMIMSTVFTEPVTYQGQETIARDLANLKAAVEAAKTEEAFVTAVAPASFSRGQNRYYPSDTDYVFALAEALHEEYKAIVDAGFILQLDDPSLADEWSLSPPELSVADYRKAQAVKIEAVNRALEGIPKDKVRYHVCWGSWHGPHTTDIPLQEIVDIILEVNADGFSVEAGNVRHEHDWKVWHDVKVPDNLVLIPGVVSHATNLIEPAELIAERIMHYTDIVGRERVIASTDCGLGGRIHPELAWAKLRALTEGAALASKKLWG